MQKRGSKFGFPEQQFYTLLAQNQDAEIAQQAEALHLRRDIVTLLTYVRDNKVVGTQSSGNMPLKAVREVTTCFVEPPKLETTIGERTYRLRSEADLWPLYFLRIIAEVGRLIVVAPARRWLLMAKGVDFLGADPLMQVLSLLAI